MSVDFLTEKENSILALAARRKIYDAVHRFAGSHFREIARKCDLPLGSVRYHLSYLVRRGLVTEQRSGNMARYYSQAIGSQDKELLGLLRQASIRSILIVVLTHAQCNQEMIVAAVKLSPSTVSYHLKKLEACNIIESHEAGRKTLYTIPRRRDDIIHLLITYQESFFDALVDRTIETWR